MRGEGEGETAGESLAAGRPQVGRRWSRFPREESLGEERVWRRKLRDPFGQVPPPPHSSASKLNKQRFQSEAGELSLVLRSAEPMVGVGTVSAHSWKL